VREGGSEHATGALDLHDSLAAALVIPLGTGGPGIGPRDSPTFIVVAAVLLFVALAACCLPAQKAMKVDPCRCVTNSMDVQVSPGLPAGGRIMDRYERELNMSFGSCLIVGFDPVCAGPRATSKRPEPH
jgi:hypothetical protein